MSGDKEEFVVVHRRPDVLSGLETLSRPLLFKEALARADELDPHQRLKLEVMSLDELERERRKLIIGLGGRLAV